MSPPCQSAWHSIESDPETYQPRVSNNPPEDRPTLARPPAGITARGLLCPAGGPIVASPSSPGFEGDEPPQTPAKTFLSPNGHTPFQAPDSKAEGCSGAHPSTLEPVKVVDLSRRR